VRVTAGAAVALLLVAAAVVAFSFTRRVEASESRVLIPIQISADAAQLVAPQAFDGAAFAVSPDGRSVALVIQSGANDPRSLYVRPIGAVTPQRLPGAEGASQLFWSADSRSIGFVVGGKLRQIDATGGPPRDICDVVDFVGGTWNQDGTIIFGTAKGLFRVSAQGGKPDQLTMLESSESGHYWPQFLPGGRRYLYLAWSRASEGRGVFAGELGIAGRTKVMASESKAEYAEPGYLVFRRENTVYAQPFNESKMTLSGEPRRIAEGVGFSGSNGDGTFNVARQGTLLFYFGSVTTGSGPQTDTSDWQLAWVDRAGQQLANPGPVGPYRGFEVSPDGTRIAVHRHEPAGGDILVLEPRGAVTRLTRDPSRHNSMPIWSPDGTRVVYASLQKNKWGLYQTLSNGSGTEELLYESDLPKAPMSWSPDGKRLVFWVQDPKTAGDLWVLTFDDKKAVPFLATPANESHAQVSFDGKWIAYTDNSIGDRNEIWVRPFPSGTGVYQISRSGGDWPRWNKNGRELFFHALGNGAFVAAMLSSAVNGSGPAFEAVDPKEIIRTALLNLPHSGGDYHSYSVSPDGERFLIVQYVAQLPTSTTTLAGADPFFGLVAVRNWVK
jgi:Tol biopolymer transport system component